MMIRLDLVSSLLFAATSCLLLHGPTSSNYAIERCTLFIHSSRILYSLSISISVIALNSIFTLSPALNIGKRLPDPFGTCSCDSGLCVRTPISTNKPLLQYMGRAVSELENLSRALEPTVQALVSYSLKSSKEHLVERVVLSLLIS
jgi:hypothetical protein